MKILLARPHCQSLMARTGIAIVEPLDLEYICAACKLAGWNVQIYDGQVERCSFAKTVTDFQPDWVVMTGYITMVDTVLEYAREVKRAVSDARVVVGGVHAEINYTDFFSPELDYIIHSGGILKVVELIKCEKPDRLPGICYKEGTAWQVNDRAAFSLEELPLPDRSHFYRNRSKFTYFGKETALVKSAYGCPYQCSFCYCRLLNDGTYQARPLAEVVDEIVNIDCATVWIVDDTFLTDKVRVTEFIDEIKHRGAQKRFIIYGRADFVAENPQLMHQLKAIGVTEIIVGLEALSDERLSAYQKGTCAHTNSLCVDVLQTAGINCTGLFIMPLDAEAHDFTRVTDWVRGRKITATVSIHTPFPGTPEYAAQQHILAPLPRKYWDFLHVTLPPSRMSTFEFYIRFYLLTIRLAASSGQLGYSLNILKNIIVR